MKPWNVVVTCRRGGEWGARKELRFFGRFHPAGFRDVLVGFVEDRPYFLEELRKAAELRDPLWRHIRRLVPVDANFAFTTGTFRERLGEEIDRLAPSVPPGPFYVRIERRGHKGEIPTPEVEREMDARIIEAHARAGAESRVSFRDFGAVVAVETFGDEGGVGLILRADMENYPFLKVA